jgi:hypothetical protein
MKKGDTITIYQDPLTRKNKEGQARLIRFVSESHDMEFWEVKFLAAGAGEPLVYRFIKKK